MAAWQGWAWWSWVTSPVSAATTDAVEATAVQIAIPTGTSGQQIGQDLESAGLIRSALAWNLWSRWQAFRNEEGGLSGRNLRH